MFPIICSDGLLSIAVEVFEILLHRVDGLVGVVEFLIMLIWIDVRRQWVCEICWNDRGCVLSKESLKELFDQIPAETRNKTRSIVDFNQNALKVLVLTHRDAADFHQEVAKLKPRTFRLNLDHLLGGINWINFQHEQIEYQISDERDLLQAIVEQGEHRSRIL